LTQFVYVLYQLLSLQEPWTLILDDALAASFVAPATDSLEDDNQLTSKLTLSMTMRQIQYMIVHPLIPRMVMTS